MGIVFLPEQKYVCGKCGSEHYEKYTEPAVSKFAGRPRPQNKALLDLIERAGRKEE